MYFCSIEFIGKSNLCSFLLALVELRVDDVPTQFGIPPHRCFQDGFVLRNISSRFIVHPQLHALFTGIGGYSLQIEIRIGFEVVELLVSAPVLPSFVPALEQGVQGFQGGGKP